MEERGPEFKITLRPEPGLSRQVTVRPDGYISFDLIGDLKVEDRTINEIRQLLTTQIREYIVSPDVTVELLQSNSRLVGGADPRLPVRARLMAEANHPGIGKLSPECILLSRNVVAAPVTARMSQGRSPCATGWPRPC